MHSANCTQNVHTVLVPGYDGSVLHFLQPTDEGLAGLGPPISTIAEGFIGYAVFWITTAMFDI